MHLFILSLTIVIVPAIVHPAFAGGIQVDRNPATNQTTIKHPGTLITPSPPPPLSFAFYLSPGGNAGSEFDGTYFYTTRWASNLIHQYDLAGNLTKEFSIPGVSGLRDLAWDGTYMYGGSGEGTIWQMDFFSEILISSIVGDFQCRALAYNEDLDVFFCSNWGDPVWIVQRDGSTTTFNLVTTTSTYGFAYESACDGNPYLWVFDQGMGMGYPQYICQWDLTAGAFTGYQFDVNASFTPPDGIAGGLWFTTEYNSSTGTLGGILQRDPDVLFGYELCDLPDLIITISPLNGTSFHPGDVIRFETKLTNRSSATIPVTARIYGENMSGKQKTLLGPWNFQIGGNATLGPVQFHLQIPYGAPSMSFYLCGEANSIHDCYLITII